MLVVDDDAGVRQAVRRALLLEGYEVALAEDGVEALRAYQRQWNEDRKVFSDRPRHDWTSHAADAFRGLALGLKPPNTAMKPLVMSNKGII